MYYFNKIPVVVLVVFVSLLNLQSTGAVNVTEIKCTTNCVCDHFRGLRRAACNEKKMIYVKDNVPRKTQILEFSYNYLTKIHNDEFLNNELEDLRMLNLSNNRISEMEIFAFMYMNKLEIIDLSKNAIQYILPEWFWSLDSLRELHLHGNNLGAFKDVAIFDSPTLQLLNMANCQLPHLFPSTFSKLTGLQILDVSGNNLIGFNTSIVHQLPNLEELKLQNNKIECKNLKELLTYLDSKTIEHTDDCQAIDDLVEDFSTNTQKHNNKFEKMIDKTQIIETSWVFEETISDKGVQEHECPSIHRPFLIEIIEWSPIITLSVTLSFGLILGVIIGCACSYCTPRKQKRSRNIKPIRQVRRSFSVIRNGSMLDRQYLIGSPQF